MNYRTEKLLIGATALTTAGVVTYFVPEKCMGTATMGVVGTLAALYILPKTHVWNKMIDRLEKNSLKSRDNSKDLSDKLNS